MMRARLLFVMGIMWSFTLYGQSTLPEFHHFMSDVRSKHLMVREELLQVDEAKREIQKARGGFDPKLSADLREKYFGGTSYYRYNDVSLKAPTLMGVEFQGGYSMNDGVYLNREYATPDNGLLHAGLSVNLGRGLLIDQRRRDLRIAKNEFELSQTIFNSYMNEFMFDAAVAYWEYYYRYVQREIMEENAENAQVRFEGLRESYFQGDIPAVDTLEAYLQWQARLVSWQEAETALQKSFYWLGDFLWGYSGDYEPECCPAIPAYDMDSLYVALSPDGLGQLRDRIRLQHPELVAYDQKAVSLEIERRWLRENLKPELALKYQFLSEPMGNYGVEGFNTNDYTWGVGVSMPLFLRKERAGVNINKLNLERNDLARQFKLIELQNKFDAQVAELQLLTEQFERVQQNVDFARRLLEAETTRFSMGESSIFLINTRENQLISFQMKMQDTFAKILKAYYGTLWASGTLASDF